MLWYILLPAGIAVTLGVLGWLGERSDAYREALAAGWAKAEPEPEPDPPDPNQEFWGVFVGLDQAFVFTVHRPHYNQFLARVRRVLPRGLVVEDPLGESMFLNYEALQYRLARDEDWDEPGLLISEANVDEEE